MTGLIVVSICAALLLAWVLDKHAERRSMETRIAQDTCEEHGVFCCSWCFGAKQDDAPGRATHRATRSFLLRVHAVRAGGETARGSRGDVRTVITLRDREHRIPFAIVVRATGDRKLTDGDFNNESLHVDRQGDVRFGDQFGPFPPHTDRGDTVLEAPIALPDLKSPDYPPHHPPPSPAPRT